jgi:hypothetical protein
VCGHRPGVPGGDFGVTSELLMLMLMLMLAASYVSP